jgi:RimJ/RimL family protein N-acetyltransferase
MPAATTTGVETSVTIRRLRASDRGMYEQAVAGLSPRSRYLRFAAPLPTLSEPLVDRMMSLDGARHVALAAVTDQPTIVGVARFVATGEPGSAEVAIAIADDWQRRGLGLELMRRVISSARGLGFRRLIATALAENEGAARLARASGFSVTARAGTQNELELDLG